ncbi:hypothetical protein WA538_003491 [Blastocystis sp. DL]
MLSGMKNFNYANITRIVFGKGQIAKLPKLIPKNKQVLVTYGGGSIKRNGVYNQVMDALKDYSVTEFGGIEANPDFDTVVKAVNVVKKMGVDNTFLLAVGGGSVADGTKFIAAASKYTATSDPWDMVTSGGKGIVGAVPLGCVMTLPATGSESNNGAVLSRRKLNMKCAFNSQFLFPQFSILDPETTMSLPTRQTANGVVDSFVHVCEQYLTVCLNADVQDRYSEALLNVLIDNGKLVMSNPHSYVARSNVMWAATQALNKWIAQGVVQDWATHMIGHELTAYLGMDHARTLACIQPRVLRFQFEDKMQKLAQMGNRVFGLPMGNVPSMAMKTVELIEDFYENTMGTPTHICQYKVGDDKKWIEEVVKKFTDQKVLLGENKKITPEVVGRIIEDSY